MLEKVEMDSISNTVCGFSRRVRRYSRKRWFDSTVNGRVVRRTDYTLQLEITGIHQSAL